MITWLLLDTEGGSDMLPRCGVPDCWNDATWVVVEVECDADGHFIGRFLCGEHLDKERERER